MEVSVRLQKHHYDVISYPCVSKSVYFVEHDIGYQLFKFQCSRMSESNFMEGVPLIVLMLSVQLIVIRIRSSCCESTCKSG